MTKSMRDLIAVVEATARITPVYPQGDQNSQQRSVPQLPAKFRPRSIRVLGAADDPEHPMKKYAVGSSESAHTDHNNPIDEDLVSRLRRDLNDFLKATDQPGRRDDGTRRAKTPTLDRLVAQKRIPYDMLLQATVESDYELSEPETDHAIHSAVDSALAQPQQPIKVM